MIQNLDINEMGWCWGGLIPGAGEDLFLKRSFSKLRQANPSRLLPLTAREARG